VAKRIPERDQDADAEGGKNIEMITLNLQHNFHQRRDSEDTVPEGGMLKCIMLKATGRYGKMHSSGKSLNLRSNTSTC
jgi:hypothetical protein